MMRYKPLLLALLISFSAPAFAAHNAAKSKENKAQSVKEQNIKSKKDTAKASGNKTSKQTVGKTSGKKTDADEPAGKQSRKGKADNKKNDTRQDKEDSKTTKRDKSEKQENPKSRKGKETLKAKEKTDEGKPSANVKKETAKADRKHKQDADQDEGGRGRKAAKKSDKQAERQENNEQQPDAVIGKNGTPQMRAAVTAAANDLESKKALYNRADALLVHVAATLRQTRNDLAGINRQQRDAWDKFQKLNADLGRLKTEVSSMRAQISRFVSGNYKNSQPNAVALFLKKAEPGQKTRFLRYTRYINTANEQVIRDLSKQQQELAAQENKINAELTRLKRLQAGVQSALRKQGVHNTAEQNESRRQNAQMAKDARKLLNRKDSEQRLNTLLDNLNKRKAEQHRKEAEARKKAAEARLAAADKARKAKAVEQKSTDGQPATSGLTAEDMNLRAPVTAGHYISTNPNSFSRMQGRLKKPVQGTLAGLFGHDRGDGEVWKGVFYQAVPSTVSSIAAGTVVYASELEGYGKVVVVDHGEGYVSIYSGLGSISVADGSRIDAGAPLGISGVLPGGEEGLYLEIRYNGQNMNPLSWIN